METLWHLHDNYVDHLWWSSVA